jgi:hypothetical protein
MCLLLDKRTSLGLPRRVRKGVKQGKFVLMHGLSSQYRDHFESFTEVPI